MPGIPYFVGLLLAALGIPLTIGCKDEALRALGALLLAAGVGMASYAVASM